jgi:predicted nucleotidyltransferase
MGTKKLKQIGQAYLKAVEAAGFPIVAAYIYGSRAKNKEHKDSDIDIAIISPALSSSSFDNRLTLRRLKDEINLLIDPVGFTPEKFQDWHPLVHEIKSTGIKLK